MTRVFQHSAAAVAALLITLVTFVPVFTVPPGDAATATVVLA